MGLPGKTFPAEDFRVVPAFTFQDEILLAFVFLLSYLYVSIF